MDHFVKVEQNDARKKTVNVRNIEPISNIEILRDYSGSDTSSVSSESTVKKTKKILRKINHREPPPRQYDQRQHDQRQHDYSFISNPKKMSKVTEEYSDESEYSSEESEISEVYSEDRETIPQEPKITFEERQKLKQDLLIKIQALEKKGFEFSKKFNMTSNYEEMVFEYEKIKKFIESQAAIKFSRRCLMACVTGIEFLNKRFDPFHVKLDGWSENVMESVDDYDNIFEKLHEKYSRKAEIAPEIELLLTLGGSAFMFHLTNSLLKGPGSFTGGAIAQNNPNFMASMMKTMSQSMKEQSKPPNFSPQQGFPKPMDTREIRKEMKGPSIDTNLFNGTPLATNYPQQSSTFSSSDLRKFYEENPIKEDDRFSVASSDSSLSSVSVGSTVKTVNVKKTTKKGKNGIELNIS